MSTFAAKRVIASAIAVIALLTGCAPNSSGGTPQSTESPANSPAATKAQLIAVAQAVYFGQNGSLSDCALVAPAGFSGYAKCPFTPQLASAFATYGPADILGCGTQAVLPAPSTYDANTRGDGGSVAVKIPSAPPVSYLLTITRVSGSLVVSAIDVHLSGTTYAMTSANCRNSVAAGG